MGRPTDFKPEYIDQAREQCEQGATDQELADFFGVSARTLYRWKNNFPEFCQALKAGKAPADERVERSLFERAVGYERDEVDIRVVNGEIVQTPIRKFYPPDTTAAIFWLKNRKPSDWRDKTDVEHSGAVKFERIECVVVDPAG
jgi:transposase-like protein